MLRTRPLVHRPATATRAVSNLATPTIKENDVVLVRQRASKGSSKWHLSQRLQPRGSTKLSWGGRAKSSDLIGRRLHEKLKDDGGRQIQVFRPSMAAYLLRAKRVATPIYPHDAATIVSLLDLHPTRPGEEDEVEEHDNTQTRTRTIDSLPLEIFEAGTGAGHLTLHIARALHAANPPVPASLRAALLNTDLTSLSVHPRPEGQVFAPTPLTGLDADASAAFEAYRSSRRAVLHSLDHNGKHAYEAYRTVRDFRRAMYLPTIDFHAPTSIAEFFTQRWRQGSSSSSSAEQVTEAEAEQKRTPFLSHAILDLPTAEAHAAPVIDALLTSGQLILFAPSVSQIAKFDDWCVAKGNEAAAAAAAAAATETAAGVDSAAPSERMLLEKVLELPNSILSSDTPDSSGGRLWDVRTVWPRDGTGTEKVRVMRPKVGDRVGGGGFVAVWRKVPAGEMVAGEEASGQAEEDVLGEVDDKDSGIESDTRA